jgi:hypothetical protein
MRIVTDEQRSAGSKAARPGGVAPGGPQEFVAPIARGPMGPRCSALLLCGLPDTITMDQCRVAGL